MLKEYWDKMFKSKDEDKIKVIIPKQEEVPVVKRVLAINQIPKKFLVIHKELKKNCNPVAKAKFINKMQRLYELKARNSHTKAYAENLLMFIQYVKRTLPL